MIEIEKILPVWKVERDAMISMSGDITFAWRVEHAETGTLSQQNFEAQHLAMVKAVRVLLPDTVLHKADWYTKGKVKADFVRAGDGVLSLASERFFNERPYLDHECFLFITLKPLARKLSSSAYANILRKSISPVEVKDEKRYKDFVSACGQFERIIADSGLMSMRRLLEPELCGTANTAGIIEKYLFLLRPNQQPVIRDIHLRDGLRVGDQHCELYTLSDAADLPAFCGSRINYDKYSTDRSKYSIGFASPLGQFLDCNHIYSQYLFIGDAHKTIKALEAKKLRLQSLSAYSRENAISRDACNDFLNEAIGQQRLPVKAHFNVLAWADNVSELAELRNKVGSAMASMDAVCKQETDGAAQIWFAGMPGNAADFPMNDTFDTFAEQAVCFFNMETSYRSSMSPFGIRLGDRTSGYPLHVDISDEPILRGWTTNRNKFIIGPSGSGKSFFTNHMVRSYYEQGAHVVLVDVGHSYKGLCDLMGGYYFTYSEKSPIRFNPFYIAEGDTLDTEKKESIKTLLMTLWKKDDESYTRSEYVAISNALTLYYEYLGLHPDVFPCFNSFYEFLMEEYLQVLEDGKVQERNFDVDNFLYVLNPYYKGGEFDYLLNATSNLDLLNERFIVFELDEIKEHAILLPIVTIIIMEVFISKMRKLKGVRKMILLEEVWKAISREGTAEYIKYLFKTVRKFFGEAVVVTQEIEDIISSPIVKQAIINNSDCKILLDQSKYQNKFDDVQALMGLTGKEKAQILSMNKANDPTKKYKEVFISLGGQQSKVYRTEVSLEEYLCYSTEEKEKMKVQEYAAKYGDIRKGIAVLAAELRNGAKIF
ncbi:TraG family conjugative transposon ATPase [Mucilaginibacter paludis]|uniref:Conjugation system ATPase, TraG family n=1 Tax=Mucilaginibacter paludis DSM 18603 TaxID=714943 RepID=H1YEB3_9SPHI|nr:TraG family conjugative transposon ATPase [Mucilaginibacter paludis]EHQ26176.1 conjugation system ATPase, TraG family [Mucilaginibacter paludis DSM 18603]